MATNLALYRKYRPQRFSELVGQEALSTALRNAVREERVRHAYLFSGPRGTGKTTTARLLAKALNCTNLGADGEPCNACHSCVEITAGSSMDVLELDAASNRGISEMRDLLGRVANRSAGGARKVYIVDEVHMLTKEASAALLKTLEEPPGHVTFVLATTDPQMVLSTIRSRTQHFPFALLGAEVLSAHLADIAGREGVEAERGALDIVARRAAGSVRDALSLMDQALAYGEGALSTDQVRVLLGGTPFDGRAVVVDAMAAGDTAALLEALDGLFSSGVDARTLADDLLRHLRDAFLLAAGGGRVRLEIPSEERDRLAAQGGAMGAAPLVRALESLGEAALEIRRAPDPRLVLEVTLVRIARRDMTSVEALAERLARLERTLADLGRDGVGGLGRSVAPSVEEPRRAPAPTEEPRRPGPAAGPRAALGALRPNRPGTGQPGPAPAAPAAPTPHPGPADGSPALSTSAVGTPALPAAPAAPPPVSDRPGGATSTVGDGPIEAPAPPMGPAPAAPTDSSTVASDAAPVTPSGSPTLDAVRQGWPEALATLKPRLRAMAKEAVPVRVDGTVVMLALPAKFSKVHLPTITAEAAVLGGALSARVGATVTVKVTLDDPVADPGPDDRAPPPDDDDDLHGDYVPPGSGIGARVDSPVDLAIEAFGATVESETVRD